MARKSRKNVEAVASAASVEEIKKPFRAGIYTRISVETEYTQEVGTIDTQVELIQNFIKGTDDISEVSVYKDSNFSGTNFERPGFRLMMEDIKHGKINCVIVKDLSRLGRNYVESSNYIERVFPFFHVRFIAVTDDFDSFREGTDLSVPFKNIINEMYSKDLARKSKSAVHALWKEGKFTGAVSPYGYKKSSADKHKLIIDVEISENVKNIFADFIKGQTYSEIARKLNEKGVLAPEAYRELSQAGHIKENTLKQWRWHHVKRILQNRYYTGDMVCGRFSCSKFDNNGKLMRNPMAEWQIVSNTHEQLISLDIFEQVQERIKIINEQYKDTYNIGSGVLKKKNLFSGKIKCGGCGKGMILVYDKYVNDYFYTCGKHSLSDVGIHQCKGYRVRKQDVEESVLRVIQSHMRSATQMEKVICKVNAEALSQERLYNIDKEITRLRKEMQRVNKRKSELYEDYTERLLTEEEYIRLSEIYTGELKKLSSTLNDSLKDRIRYAQDFHLDEGWGEAIRAFAAKRKLTSEMSDAFVERIVVCGKKQYNVFLKYDDLYRELQELYEEKGAL